MNALVNPHLLEDGATPPITSRERGQMAIQMPHDLTLRLDDESEAPAIAAEPGGGADEERADVPQGVEAAREGHETPTGSDVAALVVKHRRNQADIVIDSSDGPHAP